VTVSTLPAAPACRGSARRCGSRTGRAARRQTTCRTRSRCRWECRRTPARRRRPGLQPQIDDPVRFPHSNLSPGHSFLEQSIMFWHVYYHNSNMVGCPYRHVFGGGIQDQNVFGAKLQACRRRQGSARRSSAARRPGRRHRGARRCPACGPPTCTGPAPGAYTRPFSAQRKRFVWDKGCA